MGGLPVKIIALVYPMMLCNFMAKSIVTSSLPKLLKEYGTSEVDTGFTIGIVRSTTFAGSAITLVFWGYVSDRIGRKIPLVITSFGLAFSSLTFGFSSNLYSVLVTRFLQGCFMVLNAQCKSILAYYCNETNFTRSLSILLTAKILGRVLADVLGGTLSFPVQQFPNTFSKGGILEEKPMFLLMVMFSGGLIIATILMVIFLPWDYNRKKKISYKVLKIKGGKKKGTDIIEANTIDKDRAKTKTSLCSIICGSRMLQIFRAKEYVIICIIYGCFSFTGGLFIPFASTAKDLNGLGFAPVEIGILSSIALSMVFLFQFFLLSKICIFFGPLKSIIISMLGYAILYPLLPLFPLVKNEYVDLVLAGLWVFLRRGLKSVGYLAINVFIKESVQPEYIGSALGFAQTAYSLGNMFGPTVNGFLYSWSLNNVLHKKLGFPFNQYFAFLINSIWAICIVVLVLFLKKKSL